jgi:hypothetical protein
VNEYLRLLTPINVLKWASVAFVVALYILMVISITLALFGAF